MEEILKVEDISNKILVSGVSLHRALNSTFKDFVKKYLDLHESN